MIKQMLLLLVALFGFLSAGEEAVNLYAGRMQKLPFEIQGAFRLTADNGRVLASGVGSGEVSLQIAPLADGSAVKAVLENGELRRKLVFHNVKLLAGVPAALEFSGARRNVFLDAGVRAETKAGVVLADAPREFTAPLVLLFPSRSDFPLKVPADWNSIAMFRTKNGGALNVIRVKETSAIDLSGEAAYVEVRTGQGRRIMIFEPGFDLTMVDNMLIIQQILKEKMQ